MWILLWDPVSCTFITNQFRVLVLPTYWQFWFNDDYFRKTPNSPPQDNWRTEQAAWSLFWEEAKSFNGIICIEISRQGHSPVSSWSSSPVFPFSTREQQRPPETILERDTHWKLWRRGVLALPPSTHHHIRGSSLRHSSVSITRCCTTEDRHRGKERMGRTRTRRRMGPGRDGAEYKAAFILGISQWCSSCWKLFKASSMSDKFARQQLPGLPSPTSLTSTFQSCHSSSHY